ncbi:MAG: DUF4886 domain-containing protein [Eubacteriales bacterium]|jgi:hypothetical protein
MKILAIGNSYATDATRYIHTMAKAVGADVKIVNLYIGGCPLSKQAFNALGREREYLLEYNGESTGFYVSIHDALISDTWDYVTLQQASRFSFDYTTYQPYLTTLRDYIGTYAPKAKIAVHQTWAYEQDGCYLEAVGYARQEDMFRDLKDAYSRAAEFLKAPVIPSGDALQRLLKAGVPGVHRDGTHISLGLGRYTAGLVWLETLCGLDARENPFSATDEPVSDELLTLAKTCAHEAAEAYR